MTPPLKALLTLYHIAYFPLNPHGDCYDKPFLHSHNPKLHVVTKSFFLTLLETVIGVVVSIPDCGAKD